MLPVVPVKPGADAYPPFRPSQCAVAHSGHRAGMRTCCAREGSGRGAVAYGVGGCGEAAAVTGEATSREASRPAR